MSTFRELLRAPKTLNVSITQPAMCEVTSLKLLGIVYGREDAPTLAGPWNECVTVCLQVTA